MWITVTEDRQADEPSSHIVIMVAERAIGRKTCSSVLTVLILIFIF
jgi:hypothetical protein